MLFRSQFFSGAIIIGNVMLAWSRLIPLIVCALTSIVLYIIVNKTDIGRSIKATALNRDGALLCGIDSERAYMICMGLATAVSGIGGVALTYYYSIYPTVGSVFMNFGFTACCIGGMGSIPGAVIGGILMGLIVSVVGTFFNVSLKYVAVFALFILVVYKRPKGLFGL